MSRHPYSSEVGSFMHSMLCSLPDLFHPCEVLLTHVCNLQNPEMDLLVMLILIMMVICIRDGLSRVMFSSLVVMLLARKQLWRLLLLCLPQKLNI